MDFESEGHGPGFGLVSKTHFDRFDQNPLLNDTRPQSAHICVKVRSYQSGYVELTATKILDPIKRKKGSRVEREREHDDEATIYSIPLSDDEKKAQHRKRSVSRARQTVSRKCLAIGADRLVTLTFRENKVDRDAAFKDALKFVRRMRLKYGSFDYVFVAERQKRGAWHFHLALNRFFNIRTVQLIWESVVGKGQGNVDVSRHGKKHINRNPDSLKIARYISKYISKDFLDGNGDDFVEGRNRYRTSQGIIIPCKTRYMCLAPGMEFYLLSNIFEGVEGSRPTATYENDFCYWLSNFLKRGEEKLCH